MDESDAGMEEDVRCELGLDPRLKVSQVQVQARDGAEGTAASWTRRRSAEEAARRVVGVFY
jgi:osmotically-inducible protein OsmY